MVNLHNVFAKEVEGLRNGFKRHIYVVPEGMRAPLLEKYEADGLRGPRWRWRIVCETAGHDLPRAIFRNETVGRWAVHLRNRRTSAGAHPRSAVFMPQTVYWFEEDEDFLMFKLAGAFADDVEVRRAEPKQEAFDGWM